MSKELNKAPVEQAEPASCQGTNCGTTTGDHSSECLAEAAASQGWELKPGDLCGRDCPMRPAPAEQAGGDERAAFEYWASDEGLYPKAVERAGNCYKLAQTQSYWMAWQARAALARVADIEKQCRDDVARALGLRPSHERGFAWSYLLASIKSCVKASEDAAQAQHSVPEGFIGRLSEFLAQRGATGKALLRELRTMLATVGDK
ncbi:TPA: hypothetical protein ACXJW0_002018 [Pseudomonas aeruginosa]